ncbi:MAG: hypothetical protein HYY05_04365 [Chloroflexi bacterium]|nr:hypothetical protein [Chloroflexota bacterium]
MATGPVPLASRRVAATDDALEAYELFLERGWGDGLPIIPPTEERVRAFLAGYLDPQSTVVATLPPKWAEATVEKIAINAVMAGCRPEYLAVLVAAVEAVADERFNAYGLQATTNPATPALVINGPVAQELGFCAEAGCLGPGWRANATVGRALRLVLLNVGGGTPGIMDRATHGQPGKFAFCFAENEAESPWEPLHVEQGYRPEDSTVTAIAAGGTHNILDQGSTEAEGLLLSLAGAVAAVGCNNLYQGGTPALLVSPEHAATLASGGYSKRDVKDALYQRGRVPLAALSSGSQELLAVRRPHLFASGTPVSVPVVDNPDDLTVVVAGGPGKHSVFIPTFGAAMRTVTVRIR